MSVTEAFAMRSLASVGSTLGPDEKRSLKPCMYIYIHGITCATGFL